MNHNPFIAPYDQLPVTMPVFPLPGAIVMPGSDLPLNIFEPRYLNMVNDALGSHRMIAMIQPDPDAGDETRFCHTGCAGRITQYRETSDGRIEMVLHGVCRYDLDQVLSTTRGYRLIVPDWTRFSADYTDHEGELREEHDRLVRALKRYFEANRLETDWSELEQLPTLKLMNSLSMVLPFSERDKQALLETIAPADQLFTFIAMLGSELQVPGQVTRH